MNKKHIVVVGLGGVGGYFGFKINQANEISRKYTVSFVARGETYEKVKDNGLTLLSPEHANPQTHPDTIVQNIREIENPDLVLICVKEYDLENVCKQLLPVINENTVLLPMMNGADIYDRIRKIIPEHTVLPTCIYVASHIKERGTVEHKGKAGKMIVGRDPEHFSTSVEWITDLLSESKIDFDFKDNSLTDIWTKFIFIASFGLVTAKYNSSIGAVCTDEQQRNEAAEIMKEIKLIAAKKGIDLQEDIISATFEKASTFPFETPTSLQLDVNSGKKDNELELFAGAVLKYGAELGIETPFTQKIYTGIKAK
ncbi:2-dehydropantoate 2-reductase [Chryseobacterium sp. D764]|jgi:2-dehydropantoate 2-reductase|uniref:ketopantoate reductase family protein n=1 Tax=unclassified Chryseobacterium TaxID=2593645 RepID=UPI0009856B38|nr:MULTISPECIES: 2-dehydropantoate 2-reductase [unclassified Chryseobacterium]QXU49656.1 2-dehydropantoate 2-reductase [Chryseobacterium sp. D764]CAD0225619.1 2-dehydropantoate 2-reductase [Chryseobacterium sp. JV274]